MVSIDESKLNITFIHQFIINRLALTTVPFVGVRLVSNYLREKTQATEGRDRSGHTHMEVRQKGIDINRKTTSGVTVTIDFFSPFCTSVR